ncbi:proline racemase family protein [Sporomusa sphaeroides]|uniref:Proline racemase n=1 Tax=Sporomusa sphaeroides DSM 2875 TaxID=1337886 RepID=A0ABP2CA74_9FIRM|nr:proline racemase family protein [Sporomusa sphaeroides]OLS54627.1 proline racemase [Sporomusa sphaeroides DSM 2875]CVK20842.1 Proline racemase [Sporomusa sphaeroides DSM 2875]
MAFKRMFDAIEVHEGEPLRVVTTGVPTIPGDSVYEMCRWLEKNDDQLRLLMLREPRGTPATCCNLIVPAKDPRAAAGFIIMEQVEYPMMSGGNVMAVATALLETGLLPMQEPVTEFNLEAPAGLIPIKAECSHGKVTQVTFKNVPAFAVHLDKEIEVPHLGKVKVDIAWGGMFYVVIDATQFEGLTLVPEKGKDIVRISALVTKAAQEQIQVEHPDYPGVGITLSIMHQPPLTPGKTMRSSNVVMSGEIDFNNPATWTGALDRGCCGTGTCALMAVAYAKGKLKLNEPFYNEGLMGITFTGHAVEETEIHGYKAIVPTVGGQCWIYGFSKWVLHETDPFPNGFTIGDVW